MLNLWRERRETERKAEEEGWRERERARHEHETKRRAEDEARALEKMRQTFAKLIPEDQERVVFRICNPDAKYNDYRHDNLQTQIYRDATNMAERLILLRDAFKPKETA